MIPFLAGLAAGLATIATPAWTAPAPPFHIVGDTYEVGSQGLAIYLIKTPAGLILIDSGMPGYAPEVIKNIRALGLDPKQVKWLLNSHGHFDHAGSMGALKRLTGAKVAIMGPDVRSVETGTYPGDETDASLKFPPVKVDRVLKDGDKIELGGVVLTANLTPGHTPGCTTWTWTTQEDGRDLRVMDYCSTSVALNRLVGRPQYPGIVAEYRGSFARLKAMKADVFLAPHAEQFDQAAKQAKAQAGAPDPFVDPSELQRRVAASEAEFDTALAKQTADAAAGK